MATHKHYKVSEFSKNHQKEAVVGIIKNNIVFNEDYIATLIDNVPELLQYFKTSQRNILLENKLNDNFLEECDCCKGRGSIFSEEETNATCEICEGRGRILQ